MQKNENDLLYFSRKEKNGIVLILILNLLIYFWPDINDYFSNQKTQAVLIEKLPELKVENNGEAYESISTENRFANKSNTKEKINVHLFEFDPNKCSKNEWMRLGVKEKTAETIMNYVSKGGMFKSPEDLKKIWGLSPGQVKELMPFVKIISASKFGNKKKYSVHVQTTNSNTFIDLNTADSSLLESLPGIGPTLAGRVIKYRNKLGGFYHIEQLKEVWGLPDSILNKLKEKTIISDIVLKIDVNTADFFMLKSHPYIGYKLANTIINYRNHHGNFKSLEDIQKIILIDQKIFNRLSHYLITN